MSFNKISSLVVGTLCTVYGIICMFIKRWDMAMIMFGLSALLYNKTDSE